VIPTYGLAMLLGLMLAGIVFILSILLTWRFTQLAMTSPAHYEVTTV